MSWLPRFGWWALHEARHQLNYVSTGSTYEAVATEDVANLLVEHACLDEQRAIVDYIDRETARLDALVAAKERVLGLLAEKRRAIITRAVIHGLDPHAPLRDSGIPWLGEIPAHWGVSRLKFVARIQTGIALGKDFGSRDVVKYSYLRVANVQDGFLDLSEVKTILLPESEAGGCMLRRGDVLMNEGGDSDKLGRGAVWDGSIDPCLHQNHVFALRPTLVSSNWLATWTSSNYAKAHFETKAKQSTNLASVSAANVMELPIAVPPDGEQQGIIAHIARECATIDDVRALTERSVLLLKERRAALIAAAVTGQLDVEAAA
jgi:type I restriction enzyme S subunit